MRCGLRSSRDSWNSIDPLERRVLLSANLFLIDRDSNQESGEIAEYTDSGGTVNSHLVPGLSLPYAIGVSGSDLFVYNQGTDTVGEYTTSGKTVNANLITGITGITGIVVSGNDLFFSGFTLEEYTTSGKLVNRSLVAVQGSAIAISGSDLFVSTENNSTDPNTGYVGEYTTSGGTVNAKLITDLNGPDGLAVSGSDLFVVNNYSAKIGEYTTSGGTVNTALLTGSDPGLDDPTMIAAAGTDLFIVNYTNSETGSNAIAEYTTSGGEVDAFLVPNLPFPEGIAAESTGPSAPVGVEATAGKYAGRVKVSWDKVAGAEAYSIWRNTSKHTATATRIANTTNLYYNDKTATPGRTYDYWVRTSTAEGPSPFSKVAQGFAAPAAAAVTEIAAGGVGSTNFSSAAVVSPTDAVVLSASGKTISELLG
jgi:hypothetical protein